MITGDSLAHEKVLHGTTKDGDKKDAKKRKRMLRRL